MSRTLVFFLACLSIVAASAECDVEHFMPEMFAELKRIGNEGEARLVAELDRLTLEKQLTKAERDALIIEIADSEQTIRAENLRTNMIGEMFMLQSAAEVDCEALGKIRQQIMELEQA